MYLTVWAAWDQYHARVYVTMDGVAVKVLLELSISQINNQQ
jgi:hypothetical protein